jgi:DNA-binding CsgD family transcriptional regulator
MEFGSDGQTLWDVNPSEDHPRGMDAAAAEPPPPRPASFADLVQLVEQTYHPAVALTLPETVTVAANQAAADLFGISIAELVGRRLSTVMCGADAVRVDIALSTLSSGAIDRYCARRRLTGQRDCEAWTFARSFLVADQAVALGLVVFSDEPPRVDPIDEQLSARSDVRWESLSTARTSSVAGDRVATDDPGVILDRLPLRQREIVAALLQGERTSAIAQAIFVSKSTVRSHLAAIFKAFDVHSQNELLCKLRSQDVSPADSGRRKR